MANYIWRNRNNGYSSFLVKAYRLRQQVRTFQLSRIRAAILLEETFKPDQSIIDSVTLDNFLDYKKISDVSIRLNLSGKQYASTYTLHTQQSFVEDTEGYYLMYVPEVSQERLVPWILQQQGNAELLSPPAALDAVRNAIRKLADLHQAYDPEEIRKKTKKAAEKL